MIPVVFSLSDQNKIVINITGKDNSIEFEAFENLVEAKFGFSIEICSDRRGLVIEFENEADLLIFQLALL